MVVEGKLYKTKICMLYQSGHCRRQQCTFAHGAAELRGSLKERRDYRDGRDLRERLDRRHSPSHNSAGRGDARAAYSSRGDSPYSAGKRKRKSIDDQSDQSARLSDGADDQINDRRHPSDYKMRIGEQFRRMQSEIKVEENRKHQLEAQLEAKSREADTLSLTIKELEMQLLKEKDDSKRLTTTIKKFIKAHNRYLRSQDELRRSQGQFQKLAEQLEVDVAGPCIDDGAKMNTFIDNTRNLHTISPLADGQFDSSPLQRTRVRNDYDMPNQSGERIEFAKHRLESISRHSESSDQLKSNRLHQLAYDAHIGNGSLFHEHKSTREIQTTDTAPTGKYKVSETSTLPSTGIAAHALDEENDAPQVDDKLPTGTTLAEAEAGGSVKATNLPFLPPLPPPVPENAYAQYEGDEETVDIDGVEDDMVDIV